MRDVTTDASYDALKPPLALEKGWIHSWVPCDVKFIADMIKHRYRNSFQFENRIARYEAASVFDSFHARDSSTLRHSRMVISAGIAPTKNIARQPK